MTQITKLLHVTRYNNLMLLRKQYTMIMTVGNGSMIDKPRVRGWVVYGDNQAKYYPNRKEAELEVKNYKYSKEVGEWI